MRKKGGLNSKKRKFIREWLLTGNGTEAARKAGYTGTDASLGTTATRLLKDADISAAIKKEQARTERVLKKKFDITKESIIDQFAKIAVADPMDVLEFDPDGRLIYKKELLDTTGFNFTIYPEYQTKADKNDGVVRAKLTFHSGDRNGALEVLAKHVGLLKDGRTGSDSDSRAAVLGRLQNYFSKNRRDGSGSST